MQEQIFGVRSFFDHTLRNAGALRFSCNFPQGNWVVPRYSRRPIHPTSISRNFSERFSIFEKSHKGKNPCPCGIPQYPTRNFSLWETQRAVGKSVSGKVRFQLTNKKSWRKTQKRGGEKKESSVLLQSRRLGCLYICVCECLL